MDEYYWPPRTITQLCGTVWQLLGGVWCPEPGIPQRQVGGEE